MKQSILFYRSAKEPPKNAEIISHQLLVRGSFIDQLSAGIWTLMPLGLKVFSKIENIIREEMNRISGQEVFLPTLQPKELWERSERWDKMEPPLFKLKDIHNKEYALGSTHEEVITDLVKKYVNSYKQLPLYLYQIQNKFRNEIRVSGGLLRVREFIMKDLYSFHTDENDLDDYYQKVLEAYKKIFTRLDLDIRVVEAESGTIGGNFCHEFMALADSGEDKVLLCDDCGLAINEEAAKNKKKCLKCGCDLRVVNGIETAHIFKLGLSYSEKMGAKYTDKDGREKSMYMGCYGIGIGRLMATIIESHHDQNGIIWPASISPYQIHLLNLNNENKKSDKIYEKLTQEGIDTLYDERDVSAAVKLKDADLLGISIRAVISEKTGDKIEIKYRCEEKSEIITIDKLIKLLKNV